MVSGTGGSGGNPPPPDLTINDQGVSQEIEQLGLNAQAMLDTQGTLTDADLALLKEAANVLIGKPTLPEPDRKALNSWLAKLAEVKTRDATQHSEVDLFDPQLISDLLSSDPEMVDEALSTLMSADVDPRVTTEEKAAIHELAQTIATLDGKEAEALKKALESKDPEEIAKALQNLLEKSSITLADQSKGHLKELLHQAATTISVLNIASSFENELQVLTASTSPESIYQSLWNCIDVSVIPPGSREVVLKKLEGLASEIAQANTPPGTGIAEFQSMSPAAITEKLRQMLKYYEMAEGADKAAINSAIGNISNAVATANALSKSGGLETIFMKVVSESNPYMSPGIMATLAIVLSELGKVYMEIIKQSSQLKLNMMELMVSMAKESYNAALSAGKAKVAQLEVEVAEAKAQILGAALMIASTVAMTAFQAGYTNKQMKEYDKTHMPEYAAKRNSLIDQANDKITPKWDTDHTKWTKSQQNEYQYSQERTTFESYQQKPTQFWTAASNQFSTISQNIIKAVFTTQKESLVMDEASQTALKDMINQLVQTVMDTMRSAAEETQRASKDWQAFNQLFKDMAATITNAIYRS